MSLGLWAIGEFGSVRNAVLYLNGHSIYFGHAEVVERNLVSGLGTLSVPVTNLSKAEVVITGATSSCSCVRPIGIPLVIRARSTGTVFMQFEIPDSRDAQLVTFYLDLGAKRQVLDVAVEFD